jgi:glutaredoxin
MSLFCVRVLENMFVIRWVLGRIILLVDFITRPKAPKLSIQEQEMINDKVQHISLYQLAACPFCVKVRRAMRRNGINLPLVDIKSEQGRYREELVQGGGAAKVPCLKIDNGQQGVTWMYESKDIINFLESTAQN